MAEEITANFIRNPDLSERKDGVPGQYVGASHYRKDAATYFAQSRDARSSVDALFGSLVDPVCGVFDAAVSFTGSPDNQATEKRRLLVNCFFGFARPDLVLWWT
ncbi:hypothetical protein [Mesorhizobium argentiipisi]|uniref:Uncharacterized protein n=1 Tax=Mesorhizobium argentiipisi TaxID=3015175 RepID=A0ABU8KAR7_9HYPH